MAHACSEDNSFLMISSESNRIGQSKPMPSGRRLIHHNLSAAGRLLRSIRKLLLRTKCTISLCGFITMSSGQGCDASTWPILASLLQMWHPSLVRADTTSVLCWTGMQGFAQTWQYVELTSLMVTFMKANAIAAHLLSRMDSLPP